MTKLGAKKILPAPKTPFERDLIMALEDILKEIEDALNNLEAAKNDHETRISALEP